MYFIGLIISFIVTLLLTPLVRRISFLFDALDYPSSRRINSQPVPHLGGLAIYFGIMAGLLYVLPWKLPLKGIILCSTILLIVGIIDDRISMSPRTKFIWQLIAATLVIPFGFQIQFITNPWGGMIYLGWWGIPLTILWIVSIINMVNFIDGLDGLAAGVVAIAALTLAAVGCQEGQAFAVAVSLVIVGSTLAFLRYNFYPARIIMGDSGSMLLGFILAVTSILGALKSATAMTLVVPVLALGVPVLDMVLTIFRRIKNGHPIGKADLGHIHHRLLGLGFSHRGAVLTVYGTSIFLGVMAVLINTVNGTEGFLLLALIFVVIIYSAWRLGLFRKVDHKKRKMSGPIG